MDQHKVLLSVDNVNGREDEDFSVWSLRIFSVIEE